MYLSPVETCSMPSHLTLGERKWEEQRSGKHAEPERKAEGRHMHTDVSKYRLPTSCREVGARTDSALFLDMADFIIH